IVTEPTVSGLHDMRRVAELAAHFKVPAMACINKFDLNLEQAEEIDNFARATHIEMLGRVPFDPVFTWSMIQGQNLIEHSPESASAEEIRNIWNKILEQQLLG
ncbi:MAG: (4Fe-4S)-binding protein, partial [Desulfohalobiaceae bacterium]|nr:(4Fe-4S)-binding protein [Desulfohalobiaceae bacterium]